MSDSPAPKTAEQLLSELFNIEVRQPASASQAPQDVLNALNNGSTAAFLFGKNTPDDVLSMLASGQDVIDGKTVVILDSEVNATVLRQAVKTKGAKRNIPVVFSVPIKHPDNNGDEVTIGYRVTRATVAK